MITIGVDAHKSVHQALALDDAGTVLGHWRGANTAHSWQRLLAWAQTFLGACQWGIEGAWNYGRGLAQFLVAQGETVFEVNPRWCDMRVDQAPGSQHQEKRDGSNMQRGCVVSRHKQDVEFPHECITGRLRHRTASRRTGLGDLWQV